MNICSKYSFKKTGVSLFGLLFISLLLHSCIKEDVFGYSNFKDIKSFDLPGQAGVSTINKNERIVTIPMPEGADLTALTPINVQLSNFATLSPSADATRDFSDTLYYTVTAEDGIEARWTIVAEQAQPNPQLPNSDFDLWYTVGSYQQPGESAENTVWGTANRGIAIAGDANTNPEDLGGGDFAANMTTVAAPLLVRIAAATMFTGKFTDGFPNVNDPRSNIDFGTPFIGRPEAFKVDHRYIPGDSYEDADGNPLEGDDACDIYVLLEVREGENIQRIGTGWHRSSDQINDWTELSVDIKYGELTPADPEFEYANIRDGETWGDADATPTHITVVFSSSALGDFFTGAIGSELWVNDFELVY